MLLGKLQRKEYPAAVWVQISSVSDAHSAFEVERFVERQADKKTELVL
jgi:hypothetical protein